MEQQAEWKRKAESKDDFTRKDVNDKYQENIEVECVNCNAVGGAKIGNERKKLNK